MPTTAKSSDIAEFQQLLIGTWQNAAELTQNGRPLSFNVMPLPQDDAQPGRAPEPGAPDYGGFILKNFARRTRRSTRNRPPSSRYSSSRRR